MGIYPKLRALFDAVLAEGPEFALSRERRVALAALGGGAQSDNITPPELGAYVTKVAHHAYQVTDAQVSALRDNGLTEAEIYEATVITAVGAGWSRMEAVRRALAAAPTPLGKGAVTR